MFITDVVSKGKQGKSYSSILLRQSCRVGAAVKSITLVVLTRLAPVLEAVRRAIAHFTDSLSKLDADSDGSLHLRQAQSFGVTCQAQLGYWQVLARVLRPGTSLLAISVGGQTGEALCDGVGLCTKRQGGSLHRARAQFAPEGTVGRFEVKPPGHSAGRRSECSHAQENYQGAKTR
jgi:hypothetical protein